MLPRISLVLLLIIPVSSASALPYDEVISHLDAISDAMTDHADDPQRALLKTKIAIDRLLPDIDEDVLRLVQQAEAISSARERVKEVGEVLEALKEPLNRVRAASASLNERTRADELRAMRIDVFTRLQNLDNLLKALLRPLLMIETASRLIATAEELADEVCECDDKECVGEVVPKLEKFRQRWTKAKANEATHEAVNTAVKRAGACIAERTKGLTTRE